MRVNEEIKLVRAQLAKAYQAAEGHSTLAGEIAITCLKLDGVIKRIDREIADVTALIDEGAIAVCKECGEIELMERLDDGVCHLCMEEMELASVCGRCNGSGEDAQSVSMDKPSNCKSCRGLGTALDVRV